MFQSFSFHGWFSSDLKSPDYWRYRILWWMTSLAQCRARAFARASAWAHGRRIGAGTYAIIIEYCKRKLNVEGNLVKYLTQYCSKYDWKLTDLLSWL